MPLDFGKHLGGKGGDKSKQDLIVVGTLALVVIGWLTLKHMGAANSTQGTSAGQPGSAMDVGAATGGNSGVLNDLQNQINSLQGQITQQHNNPVGPPPTPAPLPPPIPPTPGPTPGPTPSPTPTKKQTAPAKTLAAGYGWFDTFNTSYTLGSVAQRFGVSVDQLKKWNPALAKDTGSTVLGKNTHVEVRSNAGTFNQAAYNKVNPGDAAKAAAQNASHPTTPSKTAKAPPKPVHPAQKGK